MPEITAADRAETARALGGLVRGSHVTTHAAPRPVPTAVPPVGERAPRVPDVPRRRSTDRLLAVPPVDRPEPPEVTALPWEAWTAAYDAGLVRIVRAWLRPLPALMRAKLTEATVEELALAPCAGREPRQWVAHLTDLTTALAAAEGPGGGAPAAVPSA